MKKIITIIMTFVFMLCFSLSVSAAQTYNIGYYAIPKANFSPKDPLIANHLVRYNGQNPQYYRFYAVYATHDHQLDKYIPHEAYIEMKITTNTVAYPVERVAGNWKNIQSSNLNDGILVANVDIVPKGTFSAIPASITVLSSATNGTTIYQDNNPPKDYKHTELLYMDTALIDILNITGPHPGRNSRIGGSAHLPY